MYFQSCLSWDDKFVPLFMVVLSSRTFVGISARMGVDGAFGQVGLEWVTQVRTSTSLDGGIYVHNGQSLKMVLNTPDDVIDILSFRFEILSEKNVKKKLAHQ